MPNALMLKMNPGADWKLDRMKATKWKPKPNVSEANLFQYVPGYHACMAVKDSGENLNEAGKWKAAVEQYENHTAMAFLKWLNEDASCTELPTWMNQDIMGRNTMGDKVLGQAKLLGAKGKLYMPTENSLWRTSFMEASCTIRNEWNPIWDGLHNLDGSVKSGEQGVNIMEELHDEVWKLQHKSSNKTKKTAGATAAGNHDGGGEAGPRKTSGTATNETASSASEEMNRSTSASIAAAAAATAAAEGDPIPPIPPNYVHNVSLLFALMGRPAGPENEHHQLSMEVSSGTDVESVEGEGSEGGGLKSPLSVKAIKEAGKKGAGIPSRRKEKTKEREEERKNAKVERARKSTEYDERLLSMIERSTQAESDKVFVGSLHDFMVNNKREVRPKEKDARVKSLEKEIEIYDKLGKSDKEEDKMLELVALLEAPLPEPDIPVMTPLPVSAAITEPEVHSTGAVREEVCIDLASVKGSAGGEGVIESRTSPRSIGEEEEEEEEEEKEDYIGQNGVDMSHLPQDLPDLDLPGGGALEVEHISVLPGRETVSTVTKSPGSKVPSSVTRQPKVASPQVRAASPAPLGHGLQGGACSTQAPGSQVPLIAAGQPQTTSLQVKAASPAPLGHGLQGGACSTQAPGSHSPLVAAGQPQTTFLQVRRRLRRLWAVNCRGGQALR